MTQTPASSGEPQMPPVPTSPAGYPPPAGYYPPPPPARAKNGMGTAALACGIFALLTIYTTWGAIPLGILAIVFGVRGRRRAKRGEATNGRQATIGLVCGVVGILATLVIIGVALWYVFRPDGLFPCLNTAGDDTTAQQQCEDQFHQDVPPLLRLPGR